MPNLRLCFFLLLCCTCSLLYAQATSLESIPVQHLAAQDAAELLKPHLLPEEFATHSAGSILLSASTERMALLRDVIKQLDQPKKFWLVEVRQGISSQLLQDNAFDSDVTITSRGNSGVLVLGGVSGASGQQRAMSQSLRLQENVAASLSLANAQALLLKTLEGRDKGDSQVVPSNARIEAQSGLKLALYSSASDSSIWLELAPRAPAYSTTGLPLHLSSLLLISANQWITVAEDLNDKQPASQRYVLQLRLTH